MRGELHARLAAAFAARVKAHGIVDIDDLARWYWLSRTKNDREAL